MSAPRPVSAKTALGELIGTELAARGISLSALGRSLGHSDLYFARIFRGERRMPTACLLPLARFLGHTQVPPAWLAAHTDPTTKAPAHRTRLGELLEPLLLCNGANLTQVSREMGKYDLFFLSLLTGKIKAKPHYLQQVAAHLHLAAVPEEWIAAAQADGQWVDLKRKNPLSSWLRSVRLARYPGQVKTLEKHLSARGFRCYRFAEQGSYSPSLANVHVFARFFGLEVPEEIVFYVKDRRLAAANGRKTKAPKTAFARLLVAERRKRRLTQKEVDTAIGCASYGAVRDIESGKMAHDDKIRHIALFFGYEDIPPEWLAALEESGQRMTAGNAREEAPETLPPLGAVLRRIR